ncbi:MAG: hypothetical protein B6242_11525 [Anaerolineaceae bacterium 4572_78]|nr:MAG: hypothetical protein B6242_11525 [Anaerolineaceae bacterium 4572_78]
MNKFHTNYRYTNRQTKSKYVWLKYQSILSGYILDVGGDEGHLKQYLPSDAKYWAIDLGGHPDSVVNLEKGSPPFPDNTFDCVLCLDVLEHVDNIHDVFDELCRISKKYVIISLPNPWASFAHVMLFGNKTPHQPLKFYGLPPEKPRDRHKWFFSNEEAKQFITYRAAKNYMQVVQMDNHGSDKNRHIGKRLLLNILGSILHQTRNIKLADFFAGTLWAVLEKNSG